MLTDRQCMTWGQNDDHFEPGLSFPIEALRDVRLREMTGNHLLLVDRGEGWERLVRSSNLTAWKLKPIRQVLHSVRKDGVAVFKDIENLKLKLPERQVCEKCGRMIPPRLGVCVACMSKRQLIGRMLRLMLPYKAAVALALTLMGLTTVLELVPPIISKWITDLVVVPAVGGAAPPDSFWYRFGDSGSARLLPDISHLAEPSRLAAHRAHCRAAAQPCQG